MFAADSRRPASARNSPGTTIIRRKKGRRGKRKSAGREETEEKRLEIIVCSRFASSFRFIAANDYSVIRPSVMRKGKKEKLMSKGGQEKKSKDTTATRLTGRFNGRLPLFTNRFRCWRQYEEPREGEREGGKRKRNGGGKDGGCKNLTLFPRSRSAILPATRYPLSQWEREPLAGIAERKGKRLGGKRGGKIRRRKKNSRRSTTRPARRFKKIRRNQWLLSLISQHIRIVPGEKKEKRKRRKKKTHM